MKYDLLDYKIKKMEMNLFYLKKTYISDYLIQ